MLDLYSEPFSPTGSTAAHGVLEALGRPQLDTLAVLVREAVQNSWDARVVDGALIDFTVEAVTYRGEHRDRWFSALGPEAVEGLARKEVLQSPELNVLFISDRGTGGLAGPTRSDAVGEDDVSDFVDFIRNVGQPRDTHLGGGTYGYGKSIFYLVSEVSTIVVYTRVQVPTGTESRLIGAALGHTFYRNDTKHTGRHWWGTLDSGVLEPLTGDSADAVARSLGFPAFSANETGTTIGVVGFFGLDADGEAQSLQTSCEVLAESVAWYCWPKFDIPGQQDQIRFRVTCNGDQIKIPGPEEIPSLAIFRRSMATAMDPDRHKTDHWDEVHAFRPARLLGRLALTTGLTTVSGFEARVPPFEEPAHHVALMRHPRLIVKYQPGNPLPDPNVQWAGVFITDVGVDDAFADAEPPTHDDWVKTRLPKPQRRLINIAYTRIGDIPDQYFQLGKFTPGPTEAASLGALSDQLGTLIASSAGIGARSAAEKKTPPVSVHVPRGTVSVVDGPHLVDFDGVRAQRILIHARPIGPSHLRIFPRVVVDGGRTEADPPVSALQPELLACIIGGHHIDGTPTLTDDADGEIIVSVPDDTMVDIDLHLELIDAQ